MPKPIFQAGNNSKPSIFFNMNVCLAYSTVQNSKSMESMVKMGSQFHCTSKLGIGPAEREHAIACEESDAQMFPYRL